MSNRKKFTILLAVFLVFAMVSCAKRPLKPHPENNSDRFMNMLNTPENSLEDLKGFYTNKYRDQVPREWGERVSGVITKINTNEKIIALTFDACGGGPRGNGYDSELMNFLIREKVPATLFVNARWIDVNYNSFMTLVKNPLFEIENHGYLHKPLSINGRSIYGIKGTENIGEVVEEIIINEEKITKLTGKKPKYFRSGTAYYDEVAVKIANDLGFKVVNFDVLGDAGGSFSAEEVMKACLSAQPGSIVLLHFNRPESGTAKGIMAAVPELRKRGFRFVKLEEYDTKMLSELEKPVQHFEYIVVSGDALWKISSKFEVSIHDIITLNGLKSTTLNVGQKLKIPIKDSPVTEANHLLYTVVSGDSLWKISSRFNVPIQGITELNKLNTTVLNVGQKLKIPLTSTTKIVPPVEVIHLVKSGDTIWKISNQYGTSIREVLNHNNLSENSILFNGQRIIIPVK